MPVALSDAHRLLLQGVLSERVCPALRARTLLAEALGAANVSEQQLVGALEAINERLQRLDMRLLFGLNDVSGEKFVALVNQDGDELAQAATDYTAHEIAFIQKALELVVTADKGSFVCETMQLSNKCIAGTTGQRMSAREGVRLLDELVASRWLKQSPDGQHITLGLRTMLELKGYLKNEFPDQVVDCRLCQECVGYGETCSNDECADPSSARPVRMHLRCSRVFFGRAANPVCPMCKTPWTYVDSVFEVPLGHEQAVEEPVRASAASASRRSEPAPSKRARRAPVADDNDDEDAPDEDAPEPNGSSASAPVRARRQQR